MEHGILLVNQLINDQRLLLSHEEFMLTFQLPVTLEEYIVIFDAAPQGVPQLLKFAERNDAVAESQNCEIFVGKVAITRKSCSNRHVRRCLQTILPHGQYNWTA